MALDNVKNFAKVIVSTGYNAAATSIVLNSGNGALLPSTPFNVTWWNSTDYNDPTDDPNVEIVRVTNIATDTLTVTRAQEGTTATTKNTASKTYRMIACLTAKTMNTDLGAVFSNVVGTSGNTSVTLVNGLNSNISVGASITFLRITGPSAAFSLGGFTNGVDGKELIVESAIGFPMTIVNADASSSAANRITTYLGNNIILGAANGSQARFIYDGNSSTWIYQNPQLNYVGVTVYASGTQSTTSGITFTVSWDTDEYNPLGTAMHSTSVNPTRLLAPVPGVYLVTLSIGWASNATGRRVITLSKTGTAFANNETPPAAAPNAWTQTMSAIITLTGTDYIEAKVIQTSGGALNVTNSGSGGVTSDTRMSLVRIGG